VPNVTRADGDVITASSWNANVRDQVITTCTSATRPSGTEGQFIVETDTDRLMVYNGSGWFHYGGYGTWVSHTPVITQSGAVTHTDTYCRYNRAGGIVVLEATISITSAGAANNAVLVSIPGTAAQAGNMVVGSGFIFDTSAGLNYPVIAVMNTTTAIGFVDATAATSVLAGQTGSAFSAAFASGDGISFSAKWETA